MREERGLSLAIFTFLLLLFLAPSEVVISYLVLTLRIPHASRPGIVILAGILAGPLVLCLLLSRRAHRQLVESSAHSGYGIALTTQILAWLALVSGAIFYSAIFAWAP